MQRAEHAVASYNLTSQYSVYMVTLPIVSCPQGDLGPFNPGLPVQVPVWLALNLKQRQKCRILPPPWMDVGKACELLWRLAREG